jgi:D-amino peptidase
MKILIAADMEGISGVTNWDQVMPGHPEYERFRRLMTQEVNSAILGACEAGASEVIVADGHHLGSNLLIEELDPRARLNTGSPSPYTMVQGIDPTVQAVMFVGYHARAGTRNAILDHTWSSRRVANVWVNEVLVGEIGLNAAVCGHFGVPVIMISGDQSACTEAVDLLGPIEIATTKRASGRNSAECLPPTVAQEKIYSAAVTAVSRLESDHSPPLFCFQEPVRVAIEFFNSDMADQASLLPGAARLDGRRIEFTARDIPEAYRAFRAAVKLA